MMKSKPLKLVINPFYRGIGYLAYKSLNKTLDYGIRRADGASAENFLDITIDLINYCQPDVILLVSSKGYGKPSPKMEKVIELIVTYGNQNNTILYSYNQLQLKSIFEEFGIESKMDRFRLLVKLYPALVSISPKEQTNFICSHYQSPVLDSFAAMVAHEDQILEDKPF